MSPEPQTQTGLDVGDVPPFEEPWHAQVFAITHKMAQAGHYTWTDWAERFAVALEQSRLEGGATDGSDYYDVWLATFEQLLVDLGLASPVEVADLISAWKHAYLNTPHGKAVELPARLNPKPRGQSSNSNMQNQQTQ